MQDFFLEVQKGSIFDLSGEKNLTNLWEGLVTKVHMAKYLGSEVTSEIAFNPGPQIIESQEKDSWPKHSSSHPQICMP